MKTSTSLLAILFIGLSSFAQNHPVVSGHVLENRMLRISTNFLVDANMPEVLDALITAAAHCYNGVIVADVKFGYLEEYEGTDYYENLHSFLDAAKALDIQVYPETMNFGYSSPILFHNPNLAEGLPVEDAPFLVENINGQLYLVNDPSDIFPIQNPDFEQEPSGSDVFPGWAWQDGLGAITFWDTDVAQNGNASARISNPGSSDNGNARIVQDILVTPFRDYHLSIWIKTENFDPAYLNIYILNPDNNRVLMYNPMSYNSTQDWTKYDFTFNTLDAQGILMYFGIWGGGNGDLWMDNIVIEPSRFNNILRRDGTPISITDATGTSLTEGIDVETIVDPILGVDPYPGSFSIWHEQPLIGIPSASALQVGDIVEISYYHTAIINGGQVCASLTEPEVFDITQEQLSSIRDEFVTADLFDGWFFQHDEIRVHNWDESPSYGSSGADLSFNFNTLYNQAKALDSDSKIMVWSDMFDPFHNAGEFSDPYYLVNGFWENSWAEFPEDVIVYNWNSGSNNLASAQFFADRGNEQVLAGYYDASENYTIDWLESLSDIDGIKGVMYTTWIHDYSNISSWAEDVWGSCAFLSETENLKLLTSNSLKLFPNPSADNVQLEFLDGPIESIEVVNMLGKIIWQVAGNTNEEIEIPHLGAGIYQVILHTKATTFSRKLVFVD